MKKLIVILVAFASIQAKAAYLDCPAMKELFVPLIGQTHVYASQHRYFVDLLQNNDTWRTVHKNLVASYDPEKVFFFEHEVAPESLSDAELFYLSSDFRTDTKNCDSLDTFYQNFQAALQRHVSIVTNAYANTGEFFDDVRGYARIEELSDSDLDLLSRAPRGPDELVKKVKLRLSRDYKTYRKYEATDEDAFDVTIKALRLKRASYKLNNPKLVYSVALRGAFKAIDTNSKYSWKDEAQDYLQSLESGFAGLGIEVLMAKSGVRVVSITKNGPTDLQQALKVGDVIYEANGQGLANLSMEEAVRKYLKGKTGTTVQLKVLRNGEPVTTEVTRGVVALSEENHQSEIVSGKGSKFGYYTFNSFYRGFESTKGSAQDLRDALNHFNEAEVSGLVIDLRYNLGGSLTEVKDILSALLPSGPLVQVGVPSELELSTDPDKGLIAFNKPVVVLVNKISASASEILSGVLQDYNRALVVGPDNTFGKGSGQTIFSLSDDLGIPSSRDDIGHIFTLTNFYYYLPSGRSVQFNGVEPDIVIKPNKEYIKVQSMPISERETNPNLKPTTGATNLLKDQDLLWQSSERKVLKVESIKRQLASESLPLKSANSDFQGQLDSDKELQQALLVLAGLVKYNTEFPDQEQLQAKAP